MDTKKDDYLVSLVDDQGNSFKAEVLDIFEVEGYEGNNYIVYTCYLTLTLAWAFSIITRITQINIRTFLLLIDACILLGFTLTFLTPFKERVLF